MGGNYGSQVLYLVEKLSRGEVWKIAMRQLQGRPVPPGTDALRPTIGVDCNNVIYRIGRFKRDPVAAVAAFLEEWADYGFIVLPVVNGMAPSTKQATIKHIADQEKSRLKVLQLRQQLRKMSSSLDKDSLTAAERKDLKKKCVELSKLIRKAESQSISLVPKDYAGLLENALWRIRAQEVNRSGGRVLPVQQAHYQADSLLNHLHVSFQIDMIMSNDANYPVQNGDKFIAIKEFTGPSVILSCTSQKTLDDALLASGDPSELNVSVKSPKSPIFEGLVDRRF